MIFGISLKIISDMSQDLLINKLFYSKDPFEDLKDVRPYYDGWYDNALVIDTKAAKKYKERIPYHLGDLVVGYVRNTLTISTFLPVLGRVDMIDEHMIGIKPIKVLSREVNEIPLKPLELLHEKVHPIVLTPGLLLRCGFDKYNINGFSGYRKKVNGIYVKVKFNTYRDGVLNSIKLGTNVFHCTYLHQFMEILNLYFIL